MKDVLFRLEHIETGRVLIDDISPNEINIIKYELIADGTKKLRLLGKECRIYRLSNISYRVYSLATDSDRLKSTRLMKNEAEVMLDAASNVEREVQLVKQRAEGQTKRLVHNLKSLSAKIAQEIYYIALQDKLMASPKESLNYLERQVRDSPKEAAQALLAILKYQTAQKTEFSAFNKLNGEIGQLKKETHKIHKVLMNVFYLFFNDFTDKHVQVEVQPSEIQAYFDYDSIHVCVYHLVENAAKYIKPGGNFSVSVSKVGSRIDIVFDMESLRIKEHEVKSIFSEEYSGEMACNRNLQGSGIGLYLAKEMAKLNDGDLTLLNGNPIQQITDFARNKFTLSLPATS